MAQFFPSLLTIVAQFFPRGIFPGKNFSRIKSPPPYRPCQSHQPTPPGIARIVRLPKQISTPSQIRKEDPTLCVPSPSFRQASSYLLAHSSTPAHNADALTGTFVARWIVGKHPPAFPRRVHPRNAVHAVHTQCKVLYASNILDRIFGPFSQVCCSITWFLHFLCIEDVARLNCHPFSPIFTHFHPVLLQFLCYRWMLHYDDGESPDVLYIHNATNRQLGCYTLLSGFQPSWPLPCYL